MNGIGPEQVKLFGWLAAGGINPVGVYTYNAATLSWEPQAPISGGGGGAVTIADGADVAQGSTGDAPGTNTVVGQLKEISDFLGAPLAVTGPLTDAELRAAAVPVSVAALPLPAGAATEATLATRVADATITARLNTLGQKAMAASAPVVLASDQSPFTVNTKTDLAPAAPTTAAVGVASAAAVAANAARRGLHLRNTSTAGQRISLAFDTPAVLDSGLTLYPQDVFDMEEFDFDLGEVRAIASAAAARLSVQEYAA